MAVIKTFKCIRPNEKVASLVAALPYDVYNRSEAKKEVEGKPLSFLNIDRPETAFPDDYDMYSQEVYKKASEMFEDRIADGTFICDEEEAYYIYELTMDGRSQTGIVATASVDDYLNSVIKKHENTLAKKEQDRIEHVNALSAQTGPIFLAYRAIDAINQVVSAAKTDKELYAFVSEDGIGHRVWKISDARDIKIISDSFAKCNQIYIADGHHRAASAVKVALKRREAHPEAGSQCEFNYFLSVLFPDSELMIMDYNRVVKDLNGHTKEEFLEKVGGCFEITEVNSTYKPEEKGMVGMYLEGQWYKLKAKAEICSDDPVKGLDVSLLNDNVLDPILGIKDPKNDPRIDFVGGIRGLKELERRVSEDMVVAFAMYPTSISELFAVADANELMPPKSTWFEPKLRSGLFIHRFER